MANGRHKEVELVPAAGLAGIAAAVEEANAPDASASAKKLESAASYFDREDFDRRRDAFLARLDEVRATLDFDGKVTLEGLRTFEDVREEFIEISRQAGRQKDSEAWKEVDLLGKRMRDLRFEYEMQGGFEVAEANQEAMDDMIREQLPDVLRNQEIWRSMRGGEIDDEEYARRRGLVIDYAANEVAGYKALNDALKVRPEANQALRDLLLLMRTSDRIFERVAPQRAGREVLEQELVKVTQEDRARQRREEGRGMEAGRTSTEKGARLLDQVYVRAQRLARDTDLWLPAEVSGLDVEDRLSMVTGYIQGAPEHDRVDLVDLFTKQGAEEFFERADRLRKMYKDGQRLVGPYERRGDTEYVKTDKYLKREKGRLNEEIGEDAERIAADDSWWMLRDGQAWSSADRYRLMVEVIAGDVDSEVLLARVAPERMDEFIDNLNELIGKYEEGELLKRQLSDNRSNALYEIDAREGDAIDRLKDVSTRAREKDGSRGSVRALEARREDVDFIEPIKTPRSVREEWDFEAVTPAMAAAVEAVRQQALKRDRARVAGRARNVEAESAPASTALVLLEATEEQQAIRDAARRQGRYKLADEIARSEVSPGSTALVLLRDAHEQQVVRDEARRQERYQQADKISREMIADEMERVPSMFAEINALLASPELGVAESHIVRERLAEILDVLDREDDWTVRMYKEGSINRKERDILKRRTSIHRTARQNLLRRARPILKDTLLNGSHDNTIEAPAKISGFTDTSRREAEPVAPEYPAEVLRIQTEIAAARSLLANKSADVAAINEALGRAETDHSRLLQWIEERQNAGPEKYLFVGLADSLLRELRLLQDAARERFKAQELEPEIELIEDEPVVEKAPEAEPQLEEQLAKRTSDIRSTVAGINPSVEAPAVEAEAEPRSWFGSFGRSVSKTLDYIRHGWSRVYNEEVLGELAPHELDRSIEVSKTEARVQAAAGIAGGLASALGTALAPDLLRWGTQTLAAKMDSDDMKHAVAEAIRTRRDLYRNENGLTPEGTQRWFERRLKAHQERQRELRDMLRNNRRLTPERKQELAQLLDVVLKDFEEGEAIWQADYDGRIIGGVDTALEVVQAQADRYVDAHMVSKIKTEKLLKESINSSMAVGSLAALASGSGVLFAGMHFMRGPAYSAQGFIERYVKAGREKARGERQAEVTAVGVMKEGFAEWWTKLTGKESKIRDRRQAINTLTRSLGMGTISTMAGGALVAEAAGALDLDGVLDRAAERVKTYAAELYNKWFPDVEAIAPGTPAVELASNVEIPPDVGSIFKGEIPEGSRVMGGTDKEGITYILKRVIANNPEAYGFDGDSEMSAELFAKRMAMKVAEGDGQMRRWLTEKAIDKLNLFPEFVNGEWHIAAIVDGKKLSMDDLAKLGYTSNAPASSK